MEEESTLMAPALRRLAAVSVPSLCVLALAGWALAPRASADSPPPPDRRQQPLRDGCQRNPTGLLTFTSAHWVFVYRDPTIRSVEGETSDPHVAAGDLPQGHDWYDFNTDIGLSAADRYLAGVNGGDSLHVEREYGYIPAWGLATDRDHIKLWGAWAWDCGHWGDDNIDPDFFLPGTGQIPFDPSLCTGCGESTEFHPWRGEVLRRRNPYRPQVGETETDVFISSDGTLAGAENNCALSNGPPAGTFAAYGPDFTACTFNPASHHQPVNTTDYEFFIPAPPRPSPSAFLRYRVETDPQHGKAPDEQVDVRSNGIQVRIPFKGFGSSTETQLYAKRFYVGWDGRLQYLPARLELTLKSIKVNESLDPNPDEFNENPSGPPTSSGAPPGEYNLTLDTNGFWQYLNDWVPGLGSVFDGDVFAINRAIGLNVPAGGDVRVNMDARECDLPKINPCPATPEVSDDNDNPGGAEDRFASADAAVGDHVLRPRSGFWEMSYSIRKVSSARLGPAEQAPPPGGPIVPGAGARGSCYDAYAPTSRFIRRKLRPSRRGVLLRGHTTDRGCGRGRVRRVEVVLARVVGGGCRFLGRNGRFGRRRSCRRGTYLKLGGKSWRLRVRQLSRGSYVARVRALDGIGNVELPTAPRNILRFRVR